MRIGFYAAERIEEQGNASPVEILPVSIHFRYGKWGKMCLKLLIKRIERFTGFRDPHKKEGYPPLTERLRRCRDYMITQNEKRYGIPVDEHREFPDRMDRIIEAALDRAEKILGIRPTAGETISRVYHIRQICWDRIYLPGRETLKNLPRVERSLLDLQAGEAWHAGRHMELVDFCWYFRSSLPEEENPLHIKIEYAQNLWDFANRTMGGAYSTRRIHIFPRRVIIQTAPSINLTQRLPGYRRDKKRAIQSAMDELRNAYLDCIEKVNRAD
jgi:hypothetical protein